MVCATHIIVSDGVVEASVGSPQPNGLLVICPGCILLAVKVSDMYRLATCTSGCNSKLEQWHIKFCFWSLELNSSISSSSSNYIHKFSGKDSPAGILCSILGIINMEEAAHARQFMHLQSHSYSSVTKAHLSSAMKCTYIWSHAGTGMA